MAIKDKEETKALIFEITRKRERERADLEREREMVEGEEDDRLIEDMSLSLFVDEIKVKSFFFFCKIWKKWV